MKTIRITVLASAGLHARPAQMFCATAGKFNSAVKVRNITAESDFVNAKSILSVLTLGVSKGNEIEISAEGDDETQAVQQMTQLIEENFPNGKTE